MKKLITFYALLIFFNPLTAQLSEYYYYDYEQKEGGKIYDHLKYNNTIIIAGRSFDKTKYKPAIIRIDTTGTPLWNTAINDTTSYKGPEVYIGKQMLGKDGYIYAICKDNGNANLELWKVNPANGSIIWKKAFNFTLSWSFPAFIIDFDSTKFLVSYALNYDGVGYNTRFAFVSKTSGDTLSTYPMGRMPWQDYRYGFCIDNNKDIYFTKTDSIYKLNGSNPKNFIWKQQHLSANVSDYHQIYFDTTTSSLFFLGKKNIGTLSGKIVKVNPVDGSLISTYTVASGDVEYRDMKVVNGYMYITWSHIYFGGGSYPYYATKFDMSTATADWSINYSFTGVGKPGTGSSTSAMSIDIDNIGNVYLTGYYGGSSYGPGNWGILKLNGSNGNPIYERTITEDSIKFNDISAGMAACVFNNTPYFVGELETTHSYNKRERLTFVKLNPLTGMVMLKNYIAGNFQFPSKTLFIKNYPTTQTLVMKQIGRFVELEMYNLTKNLLWKRVFMKEYFLFGCNIATAPNGEIYLSAYSKQESNISPYYESNIDSIYIFHLDSSGGVIQEYSFYSTSNIYLIDMQADNSGALLFYEKNGTIWCRNIASSMLSAEHDSKLYYYGNVSGRKYCVNKSSSKALLFGYSFSYLKTILIELDKNSMAMNYLVNIPSKYGQRINYVCEIDTNSVVLCSKTGIDREHLSLYNTSIKDTIWTKDFNNFNSQVLKCVSDFQKKYIYTISHSLSNIVVRKLAIANGQQRWEYTFNGIANLDDYPLDISFDPFRNQILVTGYETNGAYKRALILIFDTAGMPLDTIIKTGDFKGDNTSLCSQVLFDRSQWVGGNLNKNSYGLAGYIFEIADSVVIPMISVDNSAIIVSENADSVTLKFKIYNVNGMASSVIITNTGTATVSNDYIAPGSIVTFPASAINGDSIMITYIIHDDTIIESNETIIADFTEGSNAMVIGKSKIISITDNDAPSTIYVDTSTKQVIENIGTVKVKLKISNVNGKAASVNLVTTGTATIGNDYTVSASSVTFSSTAINGDSIIIYYTINDDAIFEPIAETIFTSYTASSNCVLPGGTVQTIQITDNDLNGINLINNTNDLKVFPNPFNDKLIFNYKSSLPVQIIIYDITAKLCLQESIQDSVIINTEWLAKGIYFFEINNESGTVKRGKVIKK